MKVAAEEKNLVTELRNIFRNSESREWWVEGITSYLPMTKCLIHCLP